MKRVKYLNNRDLLAQIHASKNTYCSYVAPEDARYDIIVPNLKKIKLADYTVSPRKIDKTDLVFRVMMFDHVPMDDERKRNPKTTADHHSKVNFPPFQHYKFAFFVKLVVLERGDVHF